MSAILRNRRMQLLRGVLLGLVAALLFAPSVARAISWGQVASYFDGGTYVKGKFKLVSNGTGTVKKLRYKIKSDVIPVSDGLPCTGDEVVCVTTALFNFAGTPRWVDIVTRPHGFAPYIYRILDLCAEMPALCAPGVTVIGAFYNFCYAPDATSLPPPAFLHPLVVTACPLEGAYERSLFTYPPASPTTPVIIY